MTNVADIGDARQKRGGGGGRRPPKPPREPSGDWRDSLVRTAKGKVANTVANIITILANDEEWADVFAFNEFDQGVFTRRVPPWDSIDAPATPSAGEWTDSDAVRTQAWLARHWSLSVSREAVWDAVRVLSDKHVVNPPLDWLNSLHWDGVRRVPSWLSTYVGAQASPYASNVGSWTMVAGVARLMRPGCKVDTMLVLEGAQGLKKSTAVKTLFGEPWFTDTPIDLASKDRFVAVRGRWCIEFAELDSFGRAEVSRIKTFCSSPVDDYRPPYGRGNVKVPRRCVFVGSCNESDYLKDPTGNRRFWPIRCGAIDIPALARDREQLWAEAVEMYRGGARWWPEGPEVSECEEEQADRTASDAWDELIGAYAERERMKWGGDTYIKVSAVLADVFKLEKDSWGQPEQNRVARCLVKMKWQRKQRRESGIRIWGYSPPSPSSPVSSGDK